MRIGLSAYDLPARDFVELARAADELGFSSLWLGEHIALPMGYASEHPTAGETAHQHHTGPLIDPDTSLIEPMVSLAAAAAVTRDLQLATGIYLLALRPPLITARMTTTLSEVSEGRLVLGVGSGWLEEEFTAVGVPFAERGPRFVETIEILRAAWSGQPFDHQGRFWQTGPVQVSTTPVPVPLILGGNTERALARAAALGDGWFTSGTPAFEDAVRLRDRLHQLRSDQGRTGPFRTYVRIAQADRALLERYEAAGFDDLIIWADQVWPTGGHLDDKRAALATAADRLGLTPDDPPKGG